jgi:hypothetical protein
VEWGEGESSHRHRILTVLSFVTWFIGAFEKLRKANVSFATPVCPSVWNNLAPTEGTFVKFDVDGFYKFCRENSSFVKTRQE